MSHKLLFLRVGHCQSFQRELRFLFFKAKDFQNQTAPKKTCFCCLQHHRCISSRQSFPPESVSGAAKGRRNKSQPLSERQLDSASRRLNEEQQPSAWCTQFRRPEPQLDWDYLCNPNNRDSIRSDAANRKGVGDIDKVISLWQKHRSAQLKAEKDCIWQELVDEALNIPNTSHPESPIGEESRANEVEVHSKRREFDFKPKTVVELGEKLQMLRTEYGFQLVSVPDLLHPDVIESCGFKTQGERTQVYRLHERHGPVCLAGTSEMSLGGLFMNEVLDMGDLPKKVTAVSRCFRAETSDIAEEKGIYRVHQFTKVEMFGVTGNEGNEESGQLLQELLNIERELFISLGLHFRVLDMPTEELGAPAYRKYDIETWMPGRGFWGEISSASNCTDFQSRRLNIQYRDPAGQLKFAHTVNGTACAVPRMIMALLESNQQQDGSVVLPKVLEPWLDSCILTPPSHRDPFMRIQDRRKR